MKPHARMAALLLVSIFSTAVSAKCDQFTEEMPDEVGGGTTVLTLCCNSSGEDCEVYCQDYPMEGEAACPDCP